jgi:hypothetical protein
MYASFTSPNQFLLNWGIVLVAFGADWIIMIKCAEHRIVEKLEYEKIHP